MKKERDSQQSSSPSPANDNINAAARRTAERDIAGDADLSIHSKNDDLDEGELARLGGDKNNLA